MGRGRRKHKTAAPETTLATLRKNKPKRKRKHRPSKTLAKKSWHLVGSPERLSRRLMVLMLPEAYAEKKGASGKTQSRFELKKHVLQTLKEQGKPRDPASVAKEMPVYSRSTLIKYQKQWKTFFTYIRENHGVNDVTKVKGWHVEEYMRDIIDRGVSLRTYKTYSAAISKLEGALNKACLYPINYASKLKLINKEAKGDLKLNDPRRAYVDPEASIASVANEIYSLAARLQLEGGARVAEVSELTAKRNLRGIRNGVGYVRLTNTKGGRIRVMKVSEETYRRVRDIIKTDGKFEFRRDYYSRNLARAFRGRGEDWNGTHGLRWNFAQRRFYELQSEEAKTFEEALQLVSFELGHSRPSITLHYLR